MNASILACLILIHERERLGVRWRGGRGWGAGRQVCAGVAVIGCCGGWGTESPVTVGPPHRPRPPKPTPEHPNPRVESSPRLTHVTPGVLSSARLASPPPPVAD